MLGFVNTCRKCGWRVHQSVVITADASAAHSLRLHVAVKFGPSSCRLRSGGVCGGSPPPLHTSPFGLELHSWCCRVSSSTLQNSPVILYFAPVLFTIFTIVHLQLLLPPSPSPLNYLFHLNKINNTEHASHSNQFQLRQHDQTKHCSHFSVDLTATRLSHFLPAALLEDILFSLWCHYVNQRRHADVWMRLLNEAQLLMIIRQEDPYRNQS